MKSFSSLPLMHLRRITAVKNMLSNIMKRYMRDPVKTYFGLLKIQVKF